MNRSRPPYFLLTGLILGLILGLVYARLINPPTLTNLPPRALNAADQDTYRLAIALAYQADDDLGRAAARLDLLGGSPMADLASQAQRLLAGGGSTEDARALALLAQALAQPSALIPTLQPSSTDTQPPTPTLPTFTPSPTVEITAVQSATPSLTPTITQTGAATFTPRPSATPQPTAGAPYQVKESKAVCDIPAAAGMLQIEIKDAAGKPVAGVRVLVTWPGGQNAFYTGLHPEKDPGYADFSMSEGVTYSVRAGEGGPLAEQISTAGCGAGVLGGWKVLFQQP